MISKRLEDIELADIEALVDNKAPEKRSIDYKSQINISTPTDKIEFCADVTSFANEAGGDLVIGVGEKNGVADSIEGLSNDTIDGLKSQLSHSLLQRVEPRLPQLDYKDVPISKTKSILVIRIPKSPTAPHAVKSKSGDSYRFYSRTPNGKYLLDEYEIRQAYAGSLSITEKIPAWRQSRFYKLVTNEELPTPLLSAQRLAIYVMPLVSFSSIESIDIPSIFNEFSHIPPLGATAWDHTYNHLGAATFTTSGRDVNSYNQLHRNGCIEFVTNYLLAGEKKDALPGHHIFQRTNACVPNGLALLRKVLHPYPASIAISLSGIKDTTFYTRNLFDYDLHSYPSNTLHLPISNIESETDNLQEVLKPSFDVLWNAYGLPEFRPASR